MIPKEIKHNLHYDNVRGDFLYQTLRGNAQGRVLLR